MKRTALALALLAGSFAAAPAHASTTVTIHLQFDAAATCTAGTQASCAVTLTPVYCQERLDGTLCSAEPVTVRTIAVRAGDVCVLQLAAPLGDYFVVHTQALGDVTLQAQSFTVTGAVITFVAAGVWAPASAVLAGAGFVAGPALTCDFPVGRIESVVTAVGL